ncbi:MAG: glycosyl transferase [Kiritimatiellia bacterium]
MRYGRFDDKRRRYIIEQPDTPWPWINYLGDRDYCAIISNNAGGYSFCKSPGRNRILRYRFNSVPPDRPGRFIYLRNEKGDYWSNSWSPVRKPLRRQKVVCSHGLGTTEITSRCRGIVSSVLYLVPLDAPIEIWKLTLTNRSRKPKTIDAFTYAEFSFPFFNTETNLQAILYVAQTLCNDGIIVCQSPVPGWTYRNTFFASGSPVESYDCMRESFIGPWRDESSPIAVENGRCSGSCGSGGNACGALHMKYRLEPGESAESLFFIGEGDYGEADRIRMEWTSERVETAIADLRSYWESRLDLFQCATPDGEMDSMLNVWNPYQNHVVFRWSRSASLIEAGNRDGLGYRDSLQDTLGIMYSLPDRARNTITDLLRGQASNGTALHKVQPLTLKTGTGEIPAPENVHSDDHLWIPLAVAAYVRETGKLSFLEEDVEYLDRGKAPVYEHMLASLKFARENRGPNGLSLCLTADWNDALRLGTEGESVWTSMQFCVACRDFAEMADLLKRKGDAEEALRWREEMAGAVNAHAWDGEWYRRALMRDGGTIGSKNNEAAKIWLNPQAWSVISGVAGPERGRIAMDSVKEHLASEHGIHLFSPPHTDLLKDIPGRVCYPPGLKENAGIFCHPNPWAVIAETILGRGDRAVEYHRAILPRKSNDRAELRRAEPYVYAQFVTGKSHPDFGTAHNPWVTGTAGWSYVAAVQYILGIRPVFDGLALDPCIPSEWTGFEATRVFRGARYRTKVHNPDRRAGKVRVLKVNGRSVETNVIPPSPEGRTVRVEAVVEGE